MPEAAPTINVFFLTISIVLVLTAALIWAVPSGPKCDVCETHLTEELAFIAIRKSDNKQVSLKFTVCYKCRKKYNRSIDGRKVDSFKEMDITDEV